MAALPERLSAAAVPGRASPRPWPQLRALAGPRAVVTVFLVAWLSLLVIPIAILLVYSLFTTEGFRTVYTVTSDTWVSLFSSGRWIVAWRTLVVALTVTAIALAVAFPFAFWLSKRCRSDRLRASILVALTIPFFLEVTSRTIVWRTILGAGGLVNSGLESAGIPTQAWLLYSPFAVQFGMVLMFFPAMFFPVFMAIELIDDDLIAAAEDAGASPLQVAWLVTLPLAGPGVVAGIIFTVVPSMAEFVVPQLLGGFNVNLLGNSINAALAAIKYPTAAALSAFVLASLAVLGVLFVWLARRSGLARAALSEMRQ